MDENPKQADEARLGDGRVLRQGLLDGWCWGEAPSAEEFAIQAWGPGEIPPNLH